MSEPLFKVGDFVVEEFRGSYDTGRSFAKVVRVTKTQAITEDGKRWRIDSGRRVGGRYGARIVPLTQELEERIGLQRMRQRIAAWCYKHQRYQELEHVFADTLKRLWEAMRECGKEKGNA